MVTTRSNKRGGSKDEEELAKKKARVEADRERMFTLVEDGNVEGLQDLLNTIPTENGERAELINSVDGSGNTILHVAVIFKKIPMIRWILSDEGGRAAGFTNICAAIQYSGTALQFAARDEDGAAFFAIVEGSKVENGEREQLVNAVDEYGSTILHAAALYGKISLIQWILSDTGGRAAGFTNIFAQSRTFGTALHAVIRRDHERAFFAIVEGCKVENGEREQLINSCDRCDQTILHDAAAQKGSTPIVQWILSDDGGRAAGFNKVTARDRQGRTALLASDFFYRDDVFFAFVEGCKPDELAELLNAVDNDGWNLLHNVVKFPSESIIEWVLSEEGEEAGFNKDLLLGLTNNKESVLHLATRGNDVDCLDIILSSCTTEADRKRLLLGIDNSGWSILHYCVMWYRPDNISYFLDNYPEESKLLIDRRDNEGMTPLHRAIDGGCEFNIEDEDTGPFIYALLGYDRTYEEEEEEDYDAVREVTPREVMRAVAADPNLGLKIQ